MILKSFIPYHSSSQLLPVFLLNINCMPDTISSHWENSNKENGQRSPLLKSLNSKVMWAALYSACVFSITRLVF